MARRSSAATPTGYSARFSACSDPTFHTRYRDALQESPKVVMRHADVVKLLAAQL